MAQIHGMLNFRRRKDVVFWATIVLGFFMMLRSSNLVPKSKNTFNKKKQLTRESVEFNSKGLVAHITWSKTIQFNQQTMDIPVFAIKNSILCPKRAIQRVLKISKASKKGPLLALSDKQPYTYAMLQAKLKSVSKRLGMANKPLTSHSMRRGSVEWGQRCGISDSLLKIYGGWASDSFKRYLQFPTELRVAVGLKMVKKLQTI